MKELRDKIDAIDERILELMDRRMQLAYEIGQKKKEAGLPVFVPGREKEILERVSQLPAARLESADTERLFKLIIAMGREYGEKAQRS